MSCENNAEAPFTPPPDDPGACERPEVLFEELQAFAAEGRLAPFKEVVEAELVPSPENPEPDPSWRTVVHDVVRLVKALGLSRTVSVARLAAAEEVEVAVGPVLSTTLRFVDTSTDGYEALESAAFFIERCDPDNLLSAVEGLFRVQSASGGGPWLVALIEALSELLAEPQLQPFVGAFEREAQRGRSALVILLREVFALLGDRNFSVDRINTLLESAVYPIAEDGLEEKIERLVVLLEEVTAPEAGILVPLQEAVRCGARHPEEQAQLLGLAVDLLLSEIGLDETLAAASVVSEEAVRSEFNLLADIIEIIRTDLVIRDDLRRGLILFLSRPSAPKVVPVLAEVVEEQILVGLLADALLLVEGCAP